MSAPSARPIPALSLWQPWASFMALGFKANETRHWSTSYRGPLAIQAATRLTGWGRKGTRTQVGGWEIERDSTGLLLRGPDLAWPYRLPLGEIVCVVDLRDVVPTESIEARLSTREQDLGDYTPGRYAWRTEMLHAFRRPIPATGHQGIWTWTPPSSDWHAPELARADAALAALS